jgi:uncharacterized OB-fold protein
MATKKTLPKYNNLQYRCGVCGAEIYPCEEFCNECYSEVDWDNYIAAITDEHEELFKVSPMRESD